MPDAPRPARILVLVLALAVALPGALAAQQQDSATVRDSIRRDSVARADSARTDSVRADSIRRSELARIRAEPRARVDSAPVRIERLMVEAGDSLHTRPSITAASVAADMVADMSPQAPARAPGSARMLLRDIEGSLGASYGHELRGVLTLSLKDDGTTQRLSAIDAAVLVGLPLGNTELLVGRSALPFGRVAQLHRHEMLFPDQPLPVRVLLGENGLRGTGLQLRGAKDVSRARLTLDVAAADRFGARVDSLHPAEAPDQSVAGVAAGGRLGMTTNAMRSHVEIGISSITGKREQPIGCVYEGSVGPVPCPEAINAANTRLTVFGADARLAWGAGAFVVDGEWLHMIVGATDLPAFSNAAFVPFYKGLTGTYNGGYVGARARVTSLIGAGARAEWLQNPEVSGLNDAWAGGYLDATPLPGARVALSYQRRIPSTTALATLTPAMRDARDRIVLRGTIVVGRHPRVEQN